MLSLTRPRMTMLACVRSAGARMLLLRLRQVQSSGAAADFACHDPAVVVFPRSLLGPLRNERYWPDHRRRLRLFMQGCGANHQLLELYLKPDVPCDRVPQQPPGAVRR